MLRTAVDQLFVDLIGNDDEIIFFCQRGQRFQCFAGLHRAGGVAGGVEDEHLRLRRDQPGDLSRVDLVVVFLPQTVGHGLCAEELRHVDVVEPHGVRDEDLVALVQKGGDGGIGALAHADGHENFLRGVGDVVVARQLAADRLPELVRAVV